MEYKTDKRTKNLTLRDIHVGDWVQVWSEQTERYSPPMKIISIHDDGTIYLVTSDEERCTPFEENIKNVDALPITTELLKGFGFVLEEGNKVIDWEQRRYEIAKGMLPIICYNYKTQDSAYFLNLKQVANKAVRYAEALITELKEVNKQ